MSLGFDEIWTTRKLEKASLTFMPMASAGSELKYFNFSNLWDRSVQEFMNRVRFWFSLILRFEFQGGFDLENDAQNFTTT